MKIVIAAPLYPPEIGGPATYAKLLAEGLPKEGSEVELVKFSEVRRLPRLIRHYVYYRRVVRAARDADVVVALDPVSVGFPAMKAAERVGKPFVVKIVGDYAWEQGCQRFGVTQGLDEFVKTRQASRSVRLLQGVQVRVAQSAARIIVPSEYLKGVVEAWGIAPERITVIYNSVEVPQVEVPEGRPHGFLIVSSGRRVPWKGFESLERVVARDSSWHLFIASSLSRAETLGWVKSADVFVLNSRYEGLPHALIEAMALGTPIIATRVGGTPELIEDGVTGLLIPPGDDEALYLALREVAGNPDSAHMRAEVARTRAHRFSTEAMLSVTSALLKNI
jgi:glycosyltransferase involved in cell wall biosynthesis